MSLGVPAIHAFCSEHMADIKAGKFTFGWLSFCLIQIEIIIELYFLVFMSPETVASPEWRQLLAEPALQHRVCMVAIDEAHCVYEWLVQVSYTPCELYLPCIE